uniref:Uncharacterized protein n=1 Tax=Rhizophora mucronata TaxID=61149 RepID=A0A2P2J448_RHIMU
MLMLCGFSSPVNLVLNSVFFVLPPLFLKWVFSVFFGSCFALFCLWKKKKKKRAHTGFWYSLS